MTVGHERVQPELVAPVDPETAQAIARTRDLLAYAGSVTDTILQDNEATRQLAQKEADRVLQEQIQAAQAAYDATVQTAQNIYEQSKDEHVEKRDSITGQQDQLEHLAESLASETLRRSECIANKQTTEQALADTQLLQSDVQQKIVAMTARIEPAKHELTAAQIEFERHAGAELQYGEQLSGMQHDTGPLEAGLVLMSTLGDQREAALRTLQSANATHSALVNQKKKLSEEYAAFAEPIYELMQKIAQLDEMLLQIQGNIETITERIQSLAANAAAITATNTGVKLTIAGPEYSIEPVLAPVSVTAADRGLVGHIFARGGVQLVPFENSVSAGETA